MIDIHELTFEYSAGSGSSRILDRLDLRIYEGEFVALMGANGSGKTTLARCIDGLLLPTEGSVLVDGLSTGNAETLPDIRRRVGMVFQNPDDQIVSTVVDREIAFGLENLGVPLDEMRRRVDETIRTFRMDQYRHSPTYALSGGEKQRLCIASVMAMAPSYLVLDEPTSLLDPAARRTVMSLLEHLHKTGTTIVLITQSPDEAVVAGRVIVMERGRVALDGSPTEVFACADRMIGMGLAVPFAARVALGLRRRGIDLGLIPTDEAGVVRELGCARSRGAERARAETRRKDKDEREGAGVAMRKGEGEREEGGVATGWPDAEGGDRIGEESPEPCPSPDALARPGPRPAARTEPAARCNPRPEPTHGDVPGPASETPVLTLQDVSHVYDAGLPTARKALSGVSACIHEGSCVALIGQSGSGKSTLVQHLNGLLRPTSGRVTVGLQDIWDGLKADRQTARRRVGLVFQFPELQLFAETVAEDVAFGPGNLGWEEGRVTEAVRAAMSNVGLDPGTFGGRDPFLLSGGEKRRAAIAGVLAMEPDILVLDEPTAGLDPGGVEQILAILRGLRSAGKTIILVTHDMDRVAELADQVIVMDLGRVVADGPASEVLRDAVALAGLGLEQPASVVLADRLRCDGWEIGGDVITEEELTSEVARCLDETGEA